MRLYMRKVVARAHWHNSDMGRLFSGGLHNTIHHSWTVPSPPMAMTISYPSSLLVFQLNRMTRIHCATPIHIALFHCDGSQIARNRQALPISAMGFRMILTLRGMMSPPLTRTVTCISDCHFILIITLINQRRLIRLRFRVLRVDL